MNENPTFADDGDPWTIPLHGISVPLPPTADVPRTGQPATVDLPSADTLPSLELLSDDVPTDVGFHPRLRRSA
ncbi:hypothetical protein [Limnoglobus roseus]|uniref:Uncharacterized protein n=1 Tax=Limnoglobus roseus TaxID=2598579 RepID=A0A5C1A4B6_9BACT|nr:hypothetical protein [Limnoglobus roseus]QEL13480.1 hypothetical protein PX52LOC_00337 [Limnoglobus roseus]